MELRQLRYFLAVAQERHFGRAARRLGITQPQLSRQIRQLEQQIGVSLFERTTRRVDLTPAGLLLLDRGRGIAAEMDDVLAEVYQAGSGATDVLRVGMVGSAAGTVMPEIIRASSRGQPGLRLELRGEMLTSDLEAALLDRSMDAAITRLPLSSPELDFRILRRERLVLAVPARGALGRSGSVQVADLRGERFVSYPPGSAIHRVTQQMCRDAGFPCRVAHTAGELSTVLCLVAAGEGVAVLPEDAGALRLDGVRFCGLTAAPESEIALAWRREDRSLLVAGFIELVTACVPGSGPP